jgi:type I restriction enzyme, S subunit
MLSRTASIGYSVLIGRPMATTQDFMAWAPSRDLDSRYLLLVLRAMKPEWERLAFGSTHRTIYMPDLESLRIPLPPVDEQVRISSFLSVELARIDQLMQDQLRLIELLEERVNNRILEIVGRSGLVDCGGSPVSPLKRLLEKHSRAVKAAEDVVTAFRNGQVTSRSARRTRGYTLTASVEQQGQGVEIGDVVVHGLDGFAGAIGDAETAGNCSPVYHVCTPRDGGDSTFYGRMLRVLALSNYLGEFATSTRERAVDFRNWYLFGSIPVPRVDSAVQRSIGHEIRSARPLREEVARFNERLAERRQALITAAVTGQIDVTTARGVAV